MKTPNPRGFPRCSAMAALSDSPPKTNPESHWSFNSQLANHKTPALNSRRLARIRQTAIELGLHNTVACLENPLRGSLKQATERARRIAILNAL